MGKKEAGNLGLGAVAELDRWLDGLFREGEELLNGAIQKHQANLELIARQRADLRACAVVLMRIQWKIGDERGSYCPWCYAYEYSGHLDGCVIATALALDGVQAVLKEGDDES